MGFLSSLDCKAEKTFEEVNPGLFSTLGPGLLKRYCELPPRLSEFKSSVSCYNKYISNINLRINKILNQAVAIARNLLWGGKGAHWGVQPPRTYVIQIL